MLDLLRQYNFQSFWQGDTGRYLRPEIDGFYGQEGQRISFVFTVVRRDSLRPALFRVQGKNRLRSVITPFAGTIRVKRLADLPGHAFLDVDDSSSAAYTAFAHFQFTESGGAEAGEFSGTACLDFYIDGDGHL